MLQVLTTKTDLQAVAEAVYTDPALQPSGQQRKLLAPSTADSRAAIFAAVSQVRVSSQTFTLQSAAPKPLTCPVVGA